MNITPEKIYLTKFETVNSDTYWTIEDLLDHKFRLCSVTNDIVSTLKIDTYYKCYELLEILVKEKEWGVKRETCLAKFERHIESLQLGADVRCGLITSSSDNVINKYTPYVEYMILVKKKVSDRDYDFIEFIEGEYRFDCDDEKYEVNIDRLESINTEIDKYKINLFVELESECSLGVIDGNLYFCQRYELPMDEFDMDEVKKYFK